MSWFASELQSPWRRIAWGGALAGVVGIVLGQTVLSPNDEVLYSGGVSMAHCLTAQEREICVFVYELSVGNTGRNAQEKVRVEWPLDLQRWDVGTQVADIVASARKTQEPLIQTSFDSGSSVYTIEGLAPNTLVEFKVRCMTCTPAQLHAMQQAKVRVEARGAVSEADPRVSAMRHAIMNLLRVVGLLG